MPRSLDPPPQSLVESGRYRFGTYGAPITNVNHLDVSRGLARFARNLRVKEWEAFQLGNDEWFVLGAVYTTKLLALVQVVAVHKASATAHRWESKVAPTRVRVANGLDGTRSTGSAKGFTIGLANETSGGTITVAAAHRGLPTAPEMTLSAVGRCSGDVAGHLVICHPFTDDRALYSNKVMMPMSGMLTMGTTDVRFDDDSSFMIIDDHKGEYPTPMAYDWVTGVSHEPGGPVLGFNLTHNQIRDPERYNENALFVGPMVHRLPAVTFERTGGVHRPWRIRDAHGRVDVGFTPTVRNEQHVGPRSMLADYYGPFGWFDGAIVTEAGASVSVDGLFGMGERKRIRF